MKNVVYAINLTLDGCCDHTKFNPDPDDEVLEHYTHLLRDFDLLVYGRKTYQLMVPYWPDIAKSQSETKADIEFAQTFVSKKKIVFSRSLASAEDENARIVRYEPSRRNTQTEARRGQRYFGRRCQHPFTTDGAWPD